MEVYGEEIGATGDAVAALIAQDASVGGNGSGVLWLLRIVGRWFG